MRAEDQRGLVLVLAPTSKGDVGDGGRPLIRIGLDVVELQKSALHASPSGGGHEGALASVAPPDHALDLPRNVAGTFGGSASFLIRPGADRPAWIRPGKDRPVWLRLVCRPELRLLDLVEQHRDGAIAGSAAEGTLVIAGLAPADGDGAAVGGVAEGSFRTVLGMSGRGANSAIRTSMSRLLLSLSLIHI